MYEVLKIDGPNLVTDKGCVGLNPFQYADGGKSRPVSDKDWEMMRRMFIAAPAMLAALIEARQFIANGIELGYIRKPSPGSREAVTLPAIEKAIKSAGG